MAQIVTITNPLTGQPAQVDQLEHTAQQIDDAIARSLPGGAIDIALANKAPGGFGLGTTPKLITDWNDVNVGGWFWSYAGADNAPDPTLSCFGTAYNQGNPEIFVQEVWGLANVNKYYHWMRLVYPGTGNGTPWEWPNPPMLLGVEYRTTERHNGKPVYAKRILCESMPAGAGYIDIVESNTEVPNALISTAIVIRCYGRASVAATIPFYSGAGDFMQVGSVGNCVIRLYTAQAYGGTAEITAYYVKTTD